MCLVDEPKSGAILWNYFLPLALKSVYFMVQNFEPIAIFKISNKNKMFNVAIENRLNILNPSFRQEDLEIVTMFLRL
jgi:hypothetical protein